MDLQPRLLWALTLLLQCSQNAGMDGGTPEGGCRGWGRLALRLPLLMIVDLHGLP